MTTSTDPSYVDPALIHPRAVRLVNAFKDALARMRDEEGLTFDDLKEVVGRGDVAAHVQIWSRVGWSLPMRRRSRRIWCQTA
ncbi:hypothetical protein [Streptomyces camelliae]|uniref:Uncharacterized protein n=1 Tax=Streptomyces camelliae TaxID=3004093 RepID=A0ABY7PFW0_9ACTN|nr:hypothetical protein [Streptomyces sp. HUAS 2-6]WBO69511.1 hypothetical protein O1G22_01750 [Streptomyces sp. HUAS 2-6]